MKKKILLAVLFIFLASSLFADGKVFVTGENRRRTRLIRQSVVTGMGMADFQVWIRREGRFYQVKMAVFFQEEELVTYQKFPVSLKTSELRARLIGQAREAVKEARFIEKFVFVEGGSFQMGSAEGQADERPLNNVRVDGFYMSKYEVTQGEYVSVMGQNPSRFQGDNRPVEKVSWYDAVKYCNALSAQEGRQPVYEINGSRVTVDWNANGYRLPTEAEWEYAARGGNKSGDYEYAGSGNVGRVGWSDNNSGDNTRDVGGKSPNELGLYDMSGNVWEWCWDWYGGYTEGSKTNPQGPNRGSARVLRGGGLVQLLRESAVGQSLQQQSQF